MVEFNQTMILSKRLFLQRVTNIRVKLLEILKIDMPKFSEFRLVRMMRKIESISCVQSILHTFLERRMSIESRGPNDL